MKIKIIVMRLSVLCISLTIYSNKEKAVVVVPVADLLGSPIKTSFPHLTTEQGYRQLPLAGGNTNTSSSCMRIHQLLFNETVDIIEQKGDEVLIEVSHFFHITHTHNKPHYTYWTHKENVIPFKELLKKKLDISKIPSTPSFTKKEIDNKNTVVLAMPYTDSITQQAFSAGTRFVQKHTLDKEHKDDVTVYAFDKKSFTFQEITIPRSLLLTHVENKAEKIQQFVALIRRWIQINDGFIPYVWGGTSFIHTSNGTYQEKQLTINNTACSYYDLSDYKTSPKTGMDCTGLVARATQMCGIPYFFKNSLTVSKYLKALQDTQELEEGDIIWIPGHVMIVSDLKNNLLLESRSCIYNGQGKIQEIALDKVFKGIHTYKQLIAHFHQQKILYRLGKDNDIVQTLPEFKLLKLASVWD